MYTVITQVLLRHSRVRNVIPGDSQHLSSGGMSSFDWKRMKRASLDSKQTLLARYLYYLMYYVTFFHAHRVARCTFSIVLSHMRRAECFCRFRATYRTRGNVTSRYCGANMPWFISSTFVADKPLKHSPPRGSKNPSNQCSKIPMVFLRSTRQFIWPIWRTSAFRRFSDHVLWSPEKKTRASCVFNLFYMWHMLSERQQTTRATHTERPACRKAGAECVLRRARWTIRQVRFFSRPQNADAAKGTYIRAWAAYYTCVSLCESAAGAVQLVIRSWNEVLSIELDILLSCSGR